MVQLTVSVLLANLSAAAAIVAPVRKPVSALETVQFAGKLDWGFALFARIQVLAPPLVTFKFVRFQVLTTGA
jgi:hypothetical protein